ncbi:MAG: radical SAM protein [Lachnospiraceae bacterium]|nr:radical SAM protein [Lachnospiraceae bacterium]
MYEKKFPTEIMIEATNCCNNKCFFCGSLVSKRKRGYIDEQLMLRLISEAYDNGARKISFHGMGEPCLCKGLANYVGVAKRKGYTYIYLDTNGALAAPEVIFPVIDEGLDSLKFSIHAATSETYKKITNNDVFHQVKENFVKVSNYIKERNIKCKLIGYFAESTINCNERDDFKSMFGPYASELWINPIHNASGIKPDNCNFSVTQNIASAKKIPCIELDRMIINWEGKAIACSTDWSGSLIYGDANTCSLKELWNCERILQIRKEHENIKSLSEICKRCAGV